MAEGVQVAGVVLVVDQNSEVAPFRQLIDQVSGAVRAGALEVGTRMPAVRAVADGVGVAANTAAKAYRELEAAGILESRGRSGTFVAGADVAAAALAGAAGEFAARAVAAGADVDDALSAVRRAFTRAT